MWSSNAGGPPGGATQKAHADRCISQGGLRTLSSVSVWKWSGTVPDQTFPVPTAPHCHSTHCFKSPRTKNMPLSRHLSSSILYIMSGPTWTMGSTCRWHMQLTGILCPELELRYSNYPTCAPLLPFIFLLSCMSVGTQLSAYWPMQLVVYQL